jgi:hypothetical protein
MSIGLGIEAVQVSRSAGLPARWPWTFGEVATAPTTLASLRSIPQGLQEVARRHAAFTPSPASVAQPTLAGERFPRPLSAVPRWRT